MKPPLQGVTILDLTSVLAGPSCTMYLADLGAEVIKLEPPIKGDDSRHIGPPYIPHTKRPYPSSHKRESAHQLGVNRNKRSITLNLKAPEGRELALKLAAKCDVLVENQVSGKMEGLGLGYQAIKNVRPDIIYCSITGFGQTGPFATSPGYDLIVAAEAGIVFSTGEPDRNPSRPGPPLTDLLTGLSATKSILAAILSRSQTGQGCYIDISMFDVQASTLGNLAASWLNCEVEAVRVGTGHTNLAPYQAFNTKNGQVIIAIANDTQFAKFAKELGQEAWSQGKYKTNDQRIKATKQLANEIEAVLLTNTSEHWRQRFLNKGFPFGSINSMQQVFEHPQAQARQLIQETEHALIDKARFVASAPVFNGERMKVRRPPPGLGQHNEEIYAELGYDRETIQRLREEGVI